MKKASLDTYNKLMTSNESFSNALKDGSNPEVNNYIRFELVFFYLRLNKQYLTFLDGYEELIDFLNSKGKIINNDYVIEGNRIYNIDFFMKLIEKVEEYKKHTEQQCEIIKFPAHEVQPPLEETTIYDSPIIELKDSPQKFLSFSDRRSIFEHTLVIDKDTQSYTEAVKRNYNFEVSDTIISLLHGEEPKDLITLSLIASFINFLPLLMYKETIPYTKLNIPQNVIGVAVTNYDDEEVKGKVEEIETIDKQIEKLKNRKAMMEKYAPHEKGKIALLEFKIRILERKEFEVGIESYFERTKPEKFNKNFVDNILKCFEIGYIDIDYIYKDPLVRIFNMEDNRVVFYAAIHISSLLNIVNMDQLIEHKKRYTLKSM